MMRRRDFLQAVAGATVLPCLPGLLRAEIPSSLKITRIAAFDMPGRRPKFVGKNSFRDDHGDTTNDPMLRIETNAGIEGIGWSRAGEQDCAALLGRNPFDLFARDQKRITGPLGRGTMPLWDLLGKALEQPVWRLLGGRGPERVPVYDGSIYFVDLLPQFSGNWRDQFRREIDMGRERGHRFFKVKIGRGKKWMPRAEGDARDVEVVRLIANHGGPEIGIGVDANNGYDLPGAKAFLERVGDVELAFVEEMFPEQVEQCLELKDFIKASGRKTLVADGESAGELADVAPYIEAAAVDVLQADMNRFGIEGIMAEAALAEPQRLMIAPHNWGSIFGFYAQLQIARAIPNFYRAEQDPSQTRMLIDEEYTIKDGLCTVPDSPGFGLKLDEEQFRQAKRRFDLSL